MISYLATFLVCTYRSVITSPNKSLLPVYMVYKVVKISLYRSTVKVVVLIECLSM